MPRVDPAPGRHILSVIKGNDAAHIIFDIAGWDITDDPPPMRTVGGKVVKGIKGPLPALVIYGRVVTTRTEDLGPVKPKPTYRPRRVTLNVAPKKPWRQGLKEKQQRRITSLRQLLENLIKGEEQLMREKP